MGDSGLCGDCEQRSFLAVEMDTATGKPTGRMELYQGKDRDEATAHLLYARKISNGYWRLGPSAHTVLMPGTSPTNPGKVWVMMNGSREDMWPRAIEEVPAGRR